MRLYCEARLCFELNANDNTNMLILSRQNVEMLRGHRFSVKAKFVVLLRREVQGYPVCISLLNIIAFNLLVVEIFQDTTQMLLM